MKSVDDLRSTTNDEGVLGKNIVLHEIEYSDFRSKTFAFFTTPNFITKTNFLRRLPPLSLKVKTYIIIRVVIEGGVGNEYELR